MKQHVLTSLLMAAAVFAAGTAQADVFNMPAGLTSLEFVAVGDPHNAPDNLLMTDGTAGYGAVDYLYEIGKYEVTAAQYTVFLNAVAATDTYGVYNNDMSWSAKISRSGAPGSYTYSAPPAHANRPICWVSWGDAARFCNWMHNGQPTGLQDSTTTEEGAYRLRGATRGTELLAVTRKPSALYCIPTEQEWYKAAYYDPTKGGTGAYWLYPTGSDSIPSNRLIEPDPGNNATYFDGQYTIGDPYRTEAGAHENSDSYYGTFDQGGNVFEWNEGLVAIGSYKGWRGGSFNLESNLLHASSRHTTDHAKNRLGSLGFRVARIPEPGSIPQPVDPATILDVDFNDGLVPARVIDDRGGPGVQVVPSAGDLNDTPLLLSGTANELASVAFYFPQVTEGRYRFSWDSLVLTRQPEDKDTQGHDRSFVKLLADAGGLAHVSWSLEYDFSGQMLLGCCDSSIPVSATPVGSYAAGQSDHFELSVDLDSDTYSLKVNGQLQVANGSLLFPAVGGIGFSSPGRFFLQDPAPLAVDNILVEVVPEPGTMVLLASFAAAALGGLALLRLRCKR